MDNETVTDEPGFALAEMTNHDDEAIAAAADLGIPSAPQVDTELTVEGEPPEA